MKTVQLEVQNTSPKYDENGTLYMDSIKQKEIEEILKGQDCHSVGHSKTISFEDNIITVVSP